LVMLEYLALTCLLALCAGHYFLIRGCMQIKVEAGSLTAMMDGKMAETNNLLNEVAELLDELVGAAPPTTADAQTGNPLMGLLSTFLNNNNPMASDYASTQAERTILENDPTTTYQENSERSEFSAELPSA